MLCFYGVNRIIIKFNFETNDDDELQKNSIFAFKFSKYNLKRHLQTYISP